MLQNKFIVNDKILKEYVFKVACKNLIIWGNIIGIIGIALTIFYINKNNYFQVGLNLSLSIICLFTAYISPILMLKIIKSQNKNLHNSKSYETMITFSDKIYMNEGSYSNSFDYNQITKIYKLKTCYILTIGKIPIIIEPNSFTNGSLNDFLSIITEKCINLKF